MNASRCSNTIALHHLPSSGDGWGGANKFQWRPVEAPACAPSAGFTVMIKEGDKEDDQAEGASQRLVDTQNLKRCWSCWCMREIEKSEWERHQWHNVEKLILKHHCLASAVHQVTCSNKILFVLYWGQSRGELRKHSFRKFFAENLLRKINTSSIIIVAHSSWVHQIVFTLLWLRLI